jgi:hypothetical protein
VSVRIRTKKKTEEPAKYDVQYVVSFFQLPFQLLGKEENRLPFIRGIGLPRHVRRVFVFSV